MRLWPLYCLIVFWPANLNWKPWRGFALKPVFFFVIIIIIIFVITHHHCTTIINIISLSVPLLLDTLFKYHHHHHHHHRHQHHLLGQHHHHHRRHHRRLVIIITTTTTTTTIINNIIIIIIIIVSTARSIWGVQGFMQALKTFYFIWHFPYEPILVQWLWSFSMSILFAMCYCLSAFISSLEYVYSIVSSHLISKVHLVWWFNS